jgi:CHAT domain-containing protein
MGGFAKAFLSRKAGAFVGTLWSVGDAPARNFTESFYQVLLDGHTTAKAARIARSNAKTAVDPTWLAYAVYAHPDATLRMEA